MALDNTIIKTTLVYETPGSLNSSWIAPLISQYFDLVPYDADKTYRADTVFYTGITTLGQSTVVQSGHRIVVDNLWEMPQALPVNCYRLANPNWFWYNESLWYKYLGYHNYIPVKTYKKLALIPMHKQKRHRDLVVTALAEYLNDCVWSYLEKGRGLPNDVDIAKGCSQRYFNPEWYNSTYFSLVAETSVDGPVFITEKTFKPIAFQHPFMVFGNTGTLTRLHSLGFATFDNLFDPGYDTVTTVARRLNLIKSNIENFVRAPYDNITLDKIQHNHNHFFNSTLVKQRIMDEIINPLLEYVNANP